MRKHLLLISFVMCVVGVQLNAAPITVSKARELAYTMDVFKPMTRQGGYELQCIYAPGATTRAAEFTAPYYVFGPQGGDGFIIISGDDEFPALVGYSVSSPFTGDKMPEALSAFLADYEAYVAAVQTGQVSPPDVGTRAGGIEVAPMVTARWNQGQPYNDQCNGFVTGCVATAMAQIMNYYKWPAAANSSIDTQPNNFGVTYEHAIDWNNMLDVYIDQWNSASQTYEPTYQPQQAKAVANLMALCGIGVRMYYSTSGSGALNYEVPNALINYFKYSPTVSQHQRNEYLTSEWVEMVRSNLEQKIPLLYSGSADMGHMFVCDGIDAQDLVHINWGWGGFYDGYFDMCYMDPGGSGIGGGTGGYNRFQSVIAGIKPLATGEEGGEKVPAVLTATGFSLLSDSRIPKNTPKGHFVIGIKTVENLTDATENETYYWGLAVIDKSGNIVRKLMNEVTFASGWYMADLQLNLHIVQDAVGNNISPTLPNGEYEVVPTMFKKDDASTNISECSLMYCSGGVNRFNLTVTDSELIMAPNKTFTPADLTFIGVEVPPKIYADLDNGLMLVKIKNSGSTTYQGNIKVVFKTPSGTEQEVVYYTPLFGDKEMDLPIPLPTFTTAGEYGLQVFYELTDNNYQAISSDRSYSITVLPLPQSAIVMMDYPLTIYYNKENRLDNYISAYTYLKANKVYEGPMELYALREGDPETKEILLLQCVTKVSTTSERIQGLADYSEGYRNLSAGKYNLYLKYSSEGEMIKVTPESNNNYVMELGETPTDIPLLNAPLVINDDLPLLDGQRFTIKATLVSVSGYTGRLLGSASYRDADNKWQTAALFNTLDITLLPNEPQTIELVASTIEGTPEGNYAFTFQFPYKDSFYSLPLKGYEASNSFQITHTALVVSAPLIVNEGNEVKPGSEGTVQLTVKSGIKYPSSYFYLEDIPGVLKGTTVNVETLPYNQDQVLSLPYTIEPFAVGGDYTLTVIHRDPKTGQASTLDLGEQAASAKFSVTAVKGQPIVVAPLEINEGIPLYNGQSFVIKSTLLSPSDYSGSIYGTTFYTAADGSSVAMVHIYRKDVALKAGEQQTVYLDAICYNDPPEGSYTLKALYTEGEDGIDLSLGQYAESATFQVTRTLIVVPSAIGMLNGRQLDQGSSGEVQFTVISQINHPSTYFYIEDIPGVLTGSRVNVEKLPYNQRYVLNLCYTIDEKATPGDYVLRIIHKDPVTEQPIALDLGEFDYSAKFSVVAVGDKPEVVAPIVVNEGIPLLNGQSFTIKIPLIAPAGYSGLLYGNAAYKDAGGEWNTVAYVYGKDIELKPNEQQIIELAAVCYDEAPIGSYSLSLYYAYGGYGIDLPLGAYAESAIFQVIHAPVVVSAPLVVNEGNDVEQGSEGTVQLTVVSQINHPRSYFYIDAIPGVLTGARVDVDNLPYNETIVLSLPYSVEDEAAIGEYALKVIHKDVMTEQPTELDLGEHTASAKFNVVQGTGIEGKWLAAIYAYQVPDGFVLRGLSGNEEIRVYNLSGRLLLTQQATANEVLVSSQQVDAKSCVVVVKKGTKQAVLKVVMK